MHPTLIFFLFFFNDTATTEIYTLSLHDALPISDARDFEKNHRFVSRGIVFDALSLETDESAASRQLRVVVEDRSEEHTSELHSRSDLVCRLLLEKKNNNLVGLGFTISAYISRRY